MAKKPMKSLAAFFDNPANNGNPVSPDEERFLPESLVAKFQQWAVKTISEQARKIARLNSEIEKLTAERDALKNAANTDSLTGLYNRRYVEAELEGKNDRRKTSPASQILYIDLKKFKQINDTYGHEAGDKALIETAKMLQSKIRETDVVGRIGGDEFVVILTGADDEAAAQKILDIQKGFEELFFDFGGERIQVFGTVGHYKIETMGMSAKDILTQGDMKMYAKKRDPDEPAPSGL